MRTPRPERRTCSKTQWTLSSMLLIISLRRGYDGRNQQGSNWIPKAAITPPAEPPSCGHPQIGRDREGYVSPQGEGRVSPGKQFWA